MIDIIWSHIESITVMFGVTVLQKFASMYFLKCHEDFEM